MISKQLIPLLVVSVACLAFTGCRPKGPPVQFIEGTVSVDGKLLQGVTVTFCPKEEGDSKNLNRPLMASGTTDEKGYFRVSALQGGKIDGGTTIGEYGISLVKKINTRPPPVTGPGIPPPTPEATRPIFQYDTPKIFERFDATPITVNVIKGKNRFDFGLQSDGNNYTVNGENFTVAR
jgi:hypothetical protein